MAHSESVQKGALSPYLGASWPTLAAVSVHWARQQAIVGALRGDSAGTVRDWVLQVDQEEIPRGHFSGLAATDATAPGDGEARQPRPEPCKCYTFHTQVLCCLWKAYRPR